METPGMRGAAAVVRFPGNAGEDLREKVVIALLGRGPVDVRRHLLVQDIEIFLELPPADPPQQLLSTGGVWTKKLSRCWKLPEGVVEAMTDGWDAQEHGIGESFGGLPLRSNNLRETAIAGQRGQSRQE